MKNVVIACGMQRAYFHETGTCYFGEKTEILKVRLKDYLSGISKLEYHIFFIREIHQSNDSFFRETKSYGVVGSPDIEVPEVFKTFPNMIINTTRYNAFYKTPLESELNKIKPNKVYLVGVETHTNILFTAEELRNREYETIVPEALVTSEDDFMHACGINLLTNSLSVNIE